MGDVLSTSLFLPLAFGRQTVRLCEPRSSKTFSVMTTSACLRSNGRGGATHHGDGVRALRQAIDDGALEFVHDRQILAWSLRIDYMGPTPILALANMSPQSHATFTTAEIAEAAARGVAVPEGEAKPLARAKGETPIHPKPPT